MSIGKITHAIKHGNQSITVLNEDQVFYSLLFIHHEMPADFVRQPINLCLVIDTSTSMKGYPLDVIKRTLMRLQQFMQPNDYVSVVYFNDRAETLIRPIKVSEFPTISHTLLRMHAEGGTEIYQGLRTGYTQLARSPIFNKSTSVLLLLTDGETYGDNEMCTRLVRNANQHGIIFSAFGLGEEWNDEFLDLLVGYSGGEVSYLSSVDHFESQLRKYLSRIHNVNLSQLFLNFETHPFVQIRNVYRMSNGVMPLKETSGRYCLGSLFNGNELVYLFEFQVKPITGVIKNLDLLRGTFSARGYAKTIEYRADKMVFSIPVSITKTLDHLLPEEQMLDAVYRVNLYHMQGGARKYIRQGDINAGINLLKNLARQLTAQGQAGLAASVNQEVEYIEENQRYSGTGEKQIKFGTRLLPTATKIMVNATATRKVKI